MKELTKPTWVVDYEKFQEGHLVIGSDHLARCLIRVWNFRIFSLTNIFNIKMLLAKTVLLVWREIHSKKCSRCALWKSESKHSLCFIIYWQRICINASLCFLCRLILFHSHSYEIHFIVGVVQNFYIITVSMFLFLFHLHSYQIDFQTQTKKKKLI